MPKNRRIETPGYHHLSNRGVGLDNVFLEHDEKSFFISLLCELSSEYDFDVHGYVLLPNGYNLLIKTNKSNLARFMKLLNARYTHYYNKRRFRRGYLWEGRYRSWFVSDEQFILDILAYIHFLPLYVSATASLSSYHYSSYRQFTGADERLDCLKNSIIFEHFNSIKAIEEFFHSDVDLQQINSIFSMLKKRESSIEPNPSELPFLSIEDFEGNDRENAIVKAYYKGYSQREIGDTVGISQQAVHKIIRKHMGK